MGEFIRARSAEQKALRFEEIKTAARSQFATRPYHEITLTTLAEELGWSRANLYKYVSTKEEIFLLMAEDECSAYFGALLAFLEERDEGDCPSIEDLAEAWAQVAHGHGEWFRLAELLPTVIETNVTVERLARFKTVYHALLDECVPKLAACLGVSGREAQRCFDSVSYHAIGLLGRCRSNPLVREALVSIGVTLEPVDFQYEMRLFVGMLLEAAVAGHEGR